ncbi:MAG: peptidoglycan DD-metalloendopeptidase family protein [Alkalibacterium sp.]
MNKKVIVSAMASLMLAGPLVHLTVEASQNSESAMSQEEQSFENEKAVLEEEITVTQAAIDDLVIAITNQEADAETLENEIEQLQKEIVRLEEQIEQSSEEAPSNEQTVISEASRYGQMGDVNSLAPSAQKGILAQIADRKALGRAEEKLEGQEKELENVLAELEANREDMVSQRAELEDRIVKIAEKYDLSDDEKKSFVNEQTIVAERTSRLDKEMKAEEQRILDEEQEKVEAERLAEEERKKEAEAEAKAKEEAKEKEKEEKEEKAKAEAEKDAEVEVKGEVSTSSSDEKEVTQSVGWTRPAEGRISSPFGYRTHPVTGEKKSFHAGIDIAGSGPIVASRAGTVKAASYSDTYGYRVIVDHGDGYSTLYAHLQAGMNVSTGQSVSQGQQLGIMGTTGRSTGVHLHFEIHRGGEPVDPMNYIN